MSILQIKKELETGVKKLGALISNRDMAIAQNIFDGNRTVGRSKPGIEVGSLDRWDIYEGEDNEDEL